MSTSAGRALRPAPLLRALTVCAPVLLSALALGASPRPADAQVTRADSAAVLLQAATGFEREGRWDVAEALYELITERFGRTPAATEASARLSAPASDRRERVSRVELPVFGATYGLWLGVAIPLAMGVEGSEGYGLGLLFGGPLGLFTARAAARARPWSEGQVRAVSWGGVWGTWQGYGWREALDIGQDQFCNEFGCYESGDDGEEAVAGMIFGGLAGIATGAVIARGPVGSGTSSAAQGGSTWGSVYGAMVAGVFEASEDKTLVTSLIAGNAGLIAGVGLARKFDLTRPRIRMINAGALVGGIGGLGIDLIVQPDDDATAIMIPLITSIGGLVIAAASTSDDPRSGGGSGDVEQASSGALFGIRDGALSLDVPVPVPTLLPVDDSNGRPHWRPGIRLELFRAKFH